MYLQVVGCGDAFGSGGRGNACFYLRGESGSLLLDCGPGALAGMRRLGIRPASLDAVLISHFHGDHFGGVPFLFLEGRFQEPRDRPLEVGGPPGVEARVSLLARALYRGGAASPEPSLARFHDLEPDQDHQIGPARVRPFAVRHQEEELCLGLRVTMDGRTVVYTGDTGWYPELAAAAEGADLFIWECTYRDATWGGHTRLSEVLAAREKLDCKRHLLTHMGPDVLQRMEEHDLPWAEDGMRVEL